MATIVFVVKTKRVSSVVPHPWQAAAIVPSFNFRTTLGQIHVAENGDTVEPLPFEEGNN